MVDAWPKWAQRHVVLGLDCRRLAHLLAVDTAAVRKEKLEALRDDVRRVLRDIRVGYTGLVVRGNASRCASRATNRSGAHQLRELSQRSAASSVPPGRAASTSAMTAR